MSIRLRWKLKPAAKGLMAIGSAPRGFVLHDGQKTYADISSDRRGGWYWVAGWDSDVPYKNTCDSPLPSADAAKAQAVVYVKQHIEQVNS